jgi:hypothetical protein
MKFLVQIQPNQTQQPNQPPPKPKKYRNRAIKISANEIAGVWTNVVERGRKCQICRQEIPAGYPSLRYIRDNMKFGDVPIQSEKAICRDCAIPKLEAMIVDLKKERDDTLYLRMKKNQPLPNTRW